MYIFSLNPQRRYGKIPVLLHHCSISHQSGRRRQRASTVTPLPQPLSNIRPSILSASILWKEPNIEKTKFDRFVELIVAGSEDQHFIIDNGTSSFVALADYLTANGIVPFLNSMHHTVTFHVVIVGGDNLVGSLGGFQYITKNFKNDATILVWLNPFFRPRPKGWQGLRPILHRSRKLALRSNNYPDFPKDMFGKSFARLQKDRLTFAEVCDAERAPEGYDLMTCHRLGMMRDQIFKMLEASKAF